VAVPGAIVGLYGPGRGQVSRVQSLGRSGCWYLPQREERRLGRTSGAACAKGGVSDGYSRDLFGGGQRQRDFTDFVNRYEQGHPSEGYSDQEVVDRYRDVATPGAAGPICAGAQEALARLSPETGGVRQDAAGTRACTRRGATSASRGGSWGPGWCAHRPAQHARPAAGHPRAAERQPRRPGPTRSRACSRRRCEGRVGGITAMIVNASCRGPLASDAQERRQRSVQTRLCTIRDDNGCRDATARSCVDDDGLIQQMVRDFLKAADFAVVEAVDGRTASSGRRPSCRT